MLSLTACSTQHVTAGKQTNPTGWSPTSARGRLKSSIDEEGVVPVQGHITDPAVLVGLRGLDLPAGSRRCSLDIYTEVHI